MKARLCVYLSDPAYRQLAHIANHRGASKSAVTEAALGAFLSSKPGDERDGALLRRLDRISRQIEHLGRDQVIIAETLALFARYSFTVTPPLPSVDQDAARALGRERFEAFIDQLARRLAAGDTLVRDTLEALADKEEPDASEESARSDPPGESTAESSTISESGNV